jgi:hypothetical protein
MRCHPRHRLLALAAVLAGAALPLATPAAGWHTTGHARVARSAVYALPIAVPRFFREGAWAVGEAAVDPDLFKDRTLDALRKAEEPLHYLDWEFLPPGTVLPPDRWAYTAMVIENKLDPGHVGLLPYSLLEGFQRLTVAFAEHRRYPENPYVQQKALVYAGWLAHYAGDLEQPLHTSKHHDGRANPDGSSPRSGIHQLVDGLFERVPLDAPALTSDLPVRAYPDAWAATLAEMASSHALVDRVYELEADLRAAFPPPAPGSAPATVPAPRPAISPAVVAFTGERYRATATFLASLYLTAWEQSAALELPRWHDRPRPPREGTRSRP